MLSLPVWDESPSRARDEGTTGASNKSVVAAVHKGLIGKTLVPLPGL